MEISKTTQLAWRRFLATEAGQEGLLALLGGEPLPTKSEVHNIVFDAGRVVGYREATNKIKEIINIAEKEKSADNE